MPFDQARLLARAQRALGANSPTDAVRKVRSIVGSKNIPASEKGAQIAMDALLDGRAPTPAQISALEIVIRLMRPVVLTANAELGDLPETGNKDLQPEALKSAWTHFRRLVAPLIGSIGRIEDASGNHVGTGFVAGENMIATNRHVLAVLTAGGDVLAPSQCRICFKQESGRINAKTDYANIDRVIDFHPRYDIALLGCNVGGRASVDFEDSLPEIGSTVCTIGYPGEDKKYNPLFLTPVFNGAFGVKSASLGETLDGTEGVDLFHDCSTTRGNSGSPVFALSTAKVVGIHRSGFFMYRNEAVSSRVLKTIGRPQ
ncbi:trypsin-like peptidase domain-containing protein [Bradyrhizobium sp. 200]|uniref:trypsin-like serine peptidase n=1 Tax=Bradyrhizobium sp. 200 TaxID=2782665 RepID=UPI002000548F|nr:serine protease [Bradyrhizobium sp. 200]UPJ49339.1 trypsin-like peptidase domain-containing protein [Bradyrhizobium sp. 200]